MEILIVLAVVAWVAYACCRLQGQTSANDVAPHRLSRTAASPTKTALLGGPS